MAGFCSAQANRLQISLSAGMSHVFEYGSVEDYVFSENDFPITPAHNSLKFGISLAYFFSTRMAIELDTRYFLPSRVTIEDPSDQDTVEIDTSNHLSLSLNAICKISKGKIQPYLAMGGGIDKILGKDQSAVTEYGFEIQFYRPEKTVDFSVNAGGGIQFSRNSKMGIRLDIRYIVIFSEPTVTSLNPSLGIFIRF